MTRSMRLLSAAVTAAALTLVFGASPRVHGAGGGGQPPGSTPPPPPNPPNALRLPVQGALAGQPDGPVALTFRLREGSAQLYQPAIQPLLFEETATVSMQGGRFTHSLGKTVWAGVPSSVVAGHAYLYVSWALAADPDTTLGAQSLAAAAYALTLSPGATVEASSSQPALTVSNSGRALSAESRGSSGRGVVGAATSTYGASFGVEGRSASPSGAGGLFVNTGGGDLAQARNDDAEAPVFRVTNDGDVYVQGALLPQFGPKGPKGDKGVKGDKGDTGNKGPTGSTGPAGSGGEITSIQSFCLAKVGTSCLGVCQGGTHLLAQASSPCTVDSCYYNANGGACCKCGL